MTDGVLSGWNTASVPDGDYELRLAVQDSLGLVGTALVRVIVDNQPPWAQQTSPAKITAASGGDVYTTNSEAHLYFPPHGLGEDAMVTIAAVDTAAAPGEFGPGVERMLAGYEVDGTPAGLRKPATLEMSYVAVEVPAGASPVLYHLDAESVWERLGGTVDADVKHIRVAIYVR